ncbi:MAG: DUF805 domain-containing protein [Tannerella sp.]|jgi:uncharacterized membrane protein YhaH (DUF805 family)|nr:DUF805 domain-containing protein [Tannerella sp.]
MELKKCPYCGKSILAIAKVCKHCGQSLVPQTESEPKREPVLEEQPQATIQPQIETGNEFYQQDYSGEKPKMFSDPFSFNGRIRRLEYGISVIIYYVWYIIMSLLIGSKVILLLTLSFIPAICFILAQGAKRCHDRNNSGWYQIIPLYILWLLFAEGDKNENNYGNPPK